MLRLTVGPVVAMLGLSTAACTTPDVVATFRYAAPVGSPAAGGATAGASSDAQVPGATMTAPDSGVAPNSCAALVCANFEDPVDQTQVVGSGGTLQQDCQRSRSGNCSLFASASDAGGNATLVTPLLAPQAVFLRAYVWVPGDLPLADIAIFYFGAPGQDSGLVVDLRDDDRYEVYLPENDLPFLSAPNSITKDAWVCLQLAVEIDDTAGAVTLRADDFVVVSASGVDNRPANGIEFFTVGIDWSAANQQAGGVWIDDVVVDDSPVSCL